MAGKVDAAPAAHRKTIIRSTPLETGATGEARRYWHVATEDDTLLFFMGRSYT